jgi:hypothetical protein
MAAATDMATCVVHSVANFSVFRERWRTSKFQSEREERGELEGVRSDVSPRGAPEALLSLQNASLWLVAF